MIRLRTAVVLLPLALLAACGAPSGGPSGNTRPQSSRPPQPGQPGSAAAGAEQFKGKSAQDITAALGEPNYRRREAPAEVWQYYGQGCVLDLFLYTEKGEQTVNYAELRNRNPGADPDPRCLPLLLEGKRQPES